ncbi:J domain-containing protein [Candidatus Chlorohelix sp.]|uniref:J domain-containing protein n=1 Tax=Candidatus Chlorohelix sp. TaxID=3139201 RepID=UPI003025DADC
MQSTAEQSRYIPNTDEWLAQDLYEILQVSPRAEFEVIEAAFRRLALKYHPDRNPTPATTHRMQEINRAYAVLKDPLQRTQYDSLRLQTTPEPFFRYGSAPVEAEAVATEPAPCETPEEYVESDYDWESLSCDRSESIPLWKRNLLYLMVGFILTLLLITAISVFAQSSSADTTTSRPMQLQPANTLFSDNFEVAGSANWTLDEPWHLTTRMSASGSYALWFGEENYGRYRIGLNASANLLRPLDLGGIEHPALSFQITGQTDNPQRVNDQDTLLVEIAQPGQAFATVQTVSGLISNWETIRVDLSKWSGKVIQVRLRFVSGVGNVGNGYAGFFVDDFRIER